MPMKTTIELPDELAREAKALAATEGTSLRNLIEEALLREVDRRKSAPSFQPRPDLVFDGGGLRPEVADLSWAEITELSSRESRMDLGDQHR